MTVIDIKLTADGNDYYWGSSSSFTDGVTTNNLSTSGTGDRNGYLWESVTISDGATINTAYVECYFRDAETSEQIDLYFEDAANPSAATSQPDAEGRTRTTASVAYVVDGNSPNSYFQSPSIISVINELMSSYSYASGANMHMILEGDSLSGAVRIRTHEQNPAISAHLYIDYTAAAGDSTPYLNGLRRRRFQPLLVR